MSRVVPLPESEATDKVEQNYSRIRDLLGTDTVPAPFLAYGRVPAYLQDYYMNFKKFVYNEGKLDQKTKALIALAVSTQAKCDVWSDYYGSRLQELGVDEQGIADVIAIASTNTMYNVFFKFRDLSGSDLFNGMGVGLRAHTFANTSLTDQEVELINITLSDINACKPCTAGHVEKARKLGIADDALLEAIQCAAVVYGGCHYLNAAGLSASQP